VAIRALSTAAGLVPTFGGGPPPPAGVMPDFGGGPPPPAGLPDQTPAGAEKATGLDDLQLKNGVRTILFPLLTSLGYEIKEATIEWQSCELHHSVIRNGEIERMVVQIPKDFFKHSQENFTKVFVVPMWFRENYKSRSEYKDGMTLYVFSETNNVPIRFIKGVIEKDWKNYFKITGEFVPLSQVEELETLFKAEQHKELLSTLSLLLDLKPKPLSNWEPADETMLILRLASYDGLIGVESRRACLKTMGIDFETYLGTEVGSSAPWTFATSFVQELLTKEADLALVVKYFLAEPTYPPPRKEFFKGLTRRYAGLT